MNRSNKAYDDLNVITAFTKEMTGIFEAVGFFDGCIAVYINEKYIDGNEKTIDPNGFWTPKPIVGNFILNSILQEHSAPITDLMFIVTNIYGVTIQENIPISTRLFLASSSYDQTIIIWQLYEGTWSVAQRFEFENSYCTSISADINNEKMQNTEKVYFAFSDGDAKYIDMNDATEMIHIKKYEDPPICIAIDANNSTSFYNDVNEDEKIITGNSVGEIKSSIGENTEVIKDAPSSSRILYIDIDPPFILSTYENGTVFITNQNLSQTDEITPALVHLDQFKPIMAKFDKFTHAINILSDKGHIVTVMKAPNNSYILLK